MFRPKQQAIHILGKLLVVAMLMVNTTAVWAQVEVAAQGATGTSHSTPCHSDAMSGQDKQDMAGHSCCDTAHQCASGCQCPAMASPALLDRDLFIPDLSKTQLFSVPQATPIQSEPVLFLQPPRQYS